MLRLAPIALVTLAVCLAPRISFARPVALHLAIVDGIVTTEARVAEIDLEMRELSAVAPVRSLVLHTRPGVAHQARAEADRFRAELAGLLSGGEPVEALVLQGALSVGPDGRATFPPFGAFEFEAGGAVLDHWAPLAGRLTPDAMVTVLDGHALAGDSAAAKARAQRFMTFLGAADGTFFGQTGGPDFSGLRLRLAHGSTTGEVLYPGLDWWKILGCDLKLQK